MEKNDVIHVFLQGLSHSEIKIWATLKIDTLTCLKGLVNRQFRIELSVKIIMTIKLD